MRRHEDDGGRGSGDGAAGGSLAPGRRRLRSDGRDPTTDEIALVEPAARPGRSAHARPDDAPARVGPRRSHRRAEPVDAARHTAAAPGTGPRRDPAPPAGLSTPDVGGHRHGALDDAPEPVDSAQDVNAPAATLSAAGAPPARRARRRADRPTSPSSPRGEHAADPGPTRRTRRRAAAEHTDDDPASGSVPVAGHGHGHGHGPAAPVGRPVRLLIAALLVPCVLATLVGVVVLWPRGPQPGPPQGAEQPVRGEVVAAQAADCSPGGGDRACAGLVIHMADGPLPGRDLVQVVPIEPGTPQFAVGDQVVLGWSGADPNDPGSYRVADFQRGTPMWWLAALFAAAVLVLGRWRGLAALVALGLSFVVLLQFVLPAILDGQDPLAVAIVGSGLIMFMVLYLTHGVSARTSTAVLGTLCSLALIGALSLVFSVAGRLTGLDDQTKTLIASLGTGVDARGLLLAGIVIGALGVLDDVTVTQTSAVWELHAANPALGARGLFAAAMRIGRDHVSSAVNTLVLAYAGASLPLMLLFELSGQPIGTILTQQDVATEIVRTLVGSIGLVASVPITTGLAALVASREKPA